MQDPIARADALRLRAEAEADVALAAEAVALLREVPRAREADLTLPLIAALRAFGALADNLDALDSAVVLARDLVRRGTAGPRAAAALGASLTVLGERSGDPDLLAEALSAYQAAGDGFDAAGASVDAGRMTRNRGAVLTLLAGALEDRSLLIEAVALLRGARAGFAAAGETAEAGLAAENLSHTLRLLGEKSGDPALLAEAVAAGRAALAALPDAAPGRARAMAETNLANALVALGAAHRGEALGLYRAALARLTAPGLAAQRAVVRHNLLIAGQAPG